ncbi:NACHT C-terminal helical domain 2-containing protein [Tychonema sp. BBK16]|uniref:NACHT C-terminal helical domain 2-containing protein n=3 Tax=Tychonema sp. BBK16 TaxID=2699888 RepID=UPI0038D2AB05
MTSRRSVRLSPEGGKRAKEAIVFKKLTKAQLAEQVKLSRASVANFFAGNPVDRKTFIEICRALDLSWDEVLDVSDSPNKVVTESNLDALVQENRKRVKPVIDKHCSSMRVLDMTHPVELLGKQGIYTHVNILEKISGRRRLGLTDLLQEVDANKFYRFGLSQIAEARMPGLDAANRYSKLVVLGKPGAGKTTFLKYLAMKCLDGQFQADRVPVFITLRDFAGVSHKQELLEFITNQYGEQLKSIIQYGKALILLDGLDEIRGQDAARVVNQIRQFSMSFSENQFIITCRIAAIDYIFEHFVEVEIADFDFAQINTFVMNWFKDKDSSKAQSFLQKLSKYFAIKEFSRNPLLLTLLCLVFEESANFPINRYELYKEGLDILLKRWDSQRNIERDQLSRKLSLKRKEDLLSYIAWKTFERGDYFFKRRDVEQYITEYLCNIADSESPEKTLELDSRAVLRSIEAQHSILIERVHDIYSFSHLAFHEYFTAKSIVSSIISDKSDNQALKAFVNHVSEPRWREIFILVVSMLANADDLLLLMKKAVDTILVHNNRLQEFLLQVMKKSVSINFEIEPILVRAFLFSRFLDLPFDLLESLSINKKVPDPIAVATKVNLPEVFHFSAHGIFLDDSLSSIMNMDEKNSIDANQLLDSTFETKLVVLSACETGLFENSNSDVTKLLQEINKELSNYVQSQEMTDEWWKTEGRSLVKKLRSIENEVQSVYDERFNHCQKTLLRQYYDANKLLVNCLHSDCYVSREVRQEIYDTLLLPIEEIEKHIGRKSAK